MADIVEQGSITKNFKRIVLNLQLPRHECGDMKDPKGVLKAGVTCGRVDQMCVGKLLDPAQPLEWPGI
ncbi:MAG: hypothetical protein PHP43_03835 [Methanoculleus sp.]|nr:hypothetical protein [Methanoculleus sp.]